MKVWVDTELCEANAVCMGACPDVFRLDEDDTLTILVEEVPGQHRAAVEDAVRRCPRQALRTQG